MRKIADCLMSASVVLPLCAALIVGGLALSVPDVSFAKGCGPSSASLERGPRGGCYYINRNGNKTYVDRDCCR